MEAAVVAFVEERDLVDSILVVLAFVVAAVLEAFATIVAALIDS